jgi:hypothetical protein
MSLPEPKSVDTFFSAFKKSNPFSDLTQLFNNPLPTPSGNQIIYPGKQTPQKGKARKKILDLEKKLKTRSTKAELSNSRNKSANISDFFLAKRNSPAVCAKDSPGDPGPNKKLKTTAQSPEKISPASSNHFDDEISIRSDLFTKSIQETVLAAK